MEGPPRHTPITPSSPRRCVKFVPYRHISRQVFGLAGRLLIPASQPVFRKIGPVLSRDVRSCLPLRGSSGFSPDSLLNPILQSGTVK